MCKSVPKIRDQEKTVDSVWKKENGGGTLLKTFSKKIRKTVDTIPPRSKNPKSLGT